ncbi:MAG: tyrosine-type recombinase/integrase [Pirellulales bacterium]
MTTLDELRAEYVACNPAIRSIHTENLFAIVCRHFSRFLERDALVADLNEKTLNAYARHRRTLKKAESTVENELVRLMVLWRFAALNGLVPPPMWKLKRLRPKQPESLHRHEVRAIFRAIYGAQGMFDDVPRNIYFPAVISVIWDSFERINAVRQVMRSDIEAGARYIRFRERKGHGRELRWPMRWTTRRAVRKLLAATDRERPFSVLSMPSFYDHYDQILADAGIEPKPSNRPHGLRRTGGTHYQAAGGNARDVYDHADERTTWRHYIDQSMVGIRPPMALLFNPAGPFHRLLAALGW